MRTLTLLMINLIVAGAFVSCSGQTTKDNSDKVIKDKIEVYYFHYTRRCPTCLAVEDEAKKAIKKYYSDMLKDNKITFTSVNLDEKEGEKKGKEIGATGQSLLIIKGDKKIDLTKEGFMYARTKPEKYHELLKKEINTLL